MDVVGINGGKGNPEIPWDDIKSARYWQQLLGHELGCGNCPVTAPTYSQVGTYKTDTHRYMNEIKEHGYLWGGVVVPETDTNALAEGVRRLVSAGWPPVCIFMCDLAWSVTERLWTQAETMFGAVSYTHLTLPTIYPV